MRTASVTRWLNVGIATALFAGCGGSQFSSVEPYAKLQGFALDTSKASHQKTYEYTGAKQSFEVPEGVTSLGVVAIGAAGSSYGCDQRFRGSSRGGRLTAMIAVTPHQRLIVYVGGSTTGFGSSGGFNGGGSGAYGGGGASDVRVSSGRVFDRILVAAGGGGQGGGSLTTYAFGCGGGGGGLTGGTGQIGYGSEPNAGQGGSGGTQSAGGAGGQPGKSSTSTCLTAGNPGSNGARGTGGSGGSIPDGYAGGGGGGGYFGGGDGGSGCADATGNGYPYGAGGGGGGGGSSYAEPSAKRVHLWQNWHTATSNGSVVFKWQ